MVKYFYNSILKFDFINKFKYLNLCNIPNIIEVCFMFYSDNFKNMLFDLIILKTFSNKSSKILLSFKNGNVIVSKVFIRKKLLNNVFLIITSKILPYIKLSNLLTFYLHDIELIKKLFKCPTFTSFIKLKIVIVFNSKNKQEFTFMFKNYLMTKING